MKVELEVPEALVGEMMSDISGKRGGHILGINNAKARFTSEPGELTTDRQTVHCLMPLSEMVGYNTYLRSMSKGEATFTMAFSHYEKISGQKQAEILENPFYY